MLTNLEFKAKSTQCASRVRAHLCINSLVLGGHLPLLPLTRFGLHGPFQLLGTSHDVSDWITRVLVLPSQYNSFEMYENTKHAARQNLS